MDSERYEGAKLLYERLMGGKISDGGWSTFVHIAEMGGPWLAFYDEMAALRLALAASQATARSLREAAIWMSGSDDFSPGGKAHTGFLKVRDLLAAPADESALRAVCERVAQAAFDLGTESTKGINLVSKDELLDRVLGPSGKETT